jgi:hypothetical protein
VTSAELAPPGFHRRRDRRQVRAASVCAWLITPSLARACCSRDIEGCGCELQLVDQPRILDRDAAWSAKACTGAIVHGERIASATSRSR